MGHCVRNMFPPMLHSKNNVSHPVDAAIVEPFTVLPEDSVLGPQRMHFHRLYDDMTEEAKEQCPRRCKNLDRLGICKLCKGVGWPASQTRVREELEKIHDNQF